MTTNIIWGIRKWCRRRSFTLYSSPSLGGDSSTSLWSDFKQIATLANSRKHILNFPMNKLFSRLHFLESVISWTICLSLPDVCRDKRMKGRDHRIKKIIRGKKNADFLRQQPFPPSVRAYVQHMSARVRVAETSLIPWGPWHRSWLWLPLFSCRNIMAPFSLQQCCLYRWCTHTRAAIPTVCQITYLPLKSALLPLLPPQQDPPMTTWSWIIDFPHANQLPSAGIRAVVVHS